MRFLRRFFTHFWPLSRPFSQRWTQLSCSDQPQQDSHYQHFGIFHVTPPQVVNKISL
jgi:hypothetical protein